MSKAVTSTGILVRRASIDSPPPSVVLTAVAVSAVGSDVAVVTAAAPHELSKHDVVTLAAVAGATPSVNGTYKVIDVLTPTTFTIRETVTVAGTGGTVEQDFATVAEITEVTPGGKSRNKIETSTHNDGSESHVLGILRQADPGLKVNYVGTEQTHVDINADIDTDRKAIWQIEYPSGVSRTGEGFVQNFVFDGAPVDGKQGATITLTWAGPVVDVAA